MARGHSAKLPVGRRLVIPGDNPTHALASATGFVSTAADLARFFGSLDPAAGQSVLSQASRREMIRPHWRDAYSSIGRQYGLGVMRGSTGDCEWFGHGGGFQGFISQTVVAPRHGLALSIVTNTVQRLADQWADGALHIVSALARRGAPDDRVRDWRGRWWNLWAPLDFVPLGNRVVISTPALLNPLADAAEVEVTGPDAGRIALATGFGHHGETVSRRRGADGEVEEIRFAGIRLLPEARLATELEAHYGARVPREANNHC